jgi:hypothetical protein
MSERPLLTAAEILDAEDRPALVVDVPEWGGPVRIAMMSGTDVKQWRLRLDSRSPEDKDDMVADLLVQTLINEQGTRLFEATDLKALMEKAAPILTRLFAAAMKHNRLGNTEVVAAQGESEPSRS